MGMNFLEEDIAPTRRTYICRKLKKTKWQQVESQTCLMGFLQTSAFAF
ncbi:hypothetical protein CDL12_28259 [Handroanthus impetiginosus]|uniref:Uncharacterized protein n=1 Tax=Handroanthus impetiginosus TaxID=429701 RepID=A0A2G9G1Q6_9LAMI|nr:hypothetical protein CDL12_28259 [Handroanthus impetiginosus]